jgi:hypothetical protein
MKMPIVFGFMITRSKMQVEIVYNDITALSPEYVAQGTVVETIPEMPTAKGKEAILFVNPQTKEAWYELFDRQLTQDERLEDLEKVLGIKKKKPVQKGIAQRLDDIERRITAIEVKLGCNKCLITTAWCC